jgi:hypothetical protein
LLARAAEGAAETGGPARRVSSRKSSGTRRWSLATDWLGKVRKTDPKRKLAFFTGRDQSQS